MEGKGWVDAEDLQPGDRVRQADGTTGIVWLQWNVHKTQEMYNLTVDTAHTFFVGDGQWLVHNACKPGQAGRYGDLIDESVIGDGLTPHHMPQKGHLFTDTMDGGALVLPEKLHQLTRTYGWRGVKTLKDEAGMLFRDVLARDLWDIKKLTGSKYNKGLKGVINYYWNNFSGLIGK